jgi:hypothetical protein
MRPMSSLKHYIKTFAGQPTPSNILVINRVINRTVKKVLAIPIPIQFSKKDCNTNAILHNIAIPIPILSLLFAMM